MSDSAATRESTSTLDNLQTAFNGESNANAGYVAFAALLRAEEIHAPNHSDVIRKMGARPALNLKPIEVKSTQENLKTAIAVEKFERDITYSEFVEVATHKKATAGIRTFTFALKVRSCSRGAAPGCMGQPAEADR